MASPFVLRPRWRKVLADLVDNKVRSLLVVASIAVGVFAVGMVAGSYVMISSDLALSYAAANPAHIALRVDPFGPDLVESVARLPGVAAAEGRQELVVRVRTPDGFWDTLTLRAVPNVAESAIDLLLPVSGAVAPADREVLLEHQTMETLGVAPGDGLTVELPDGSARTLRVAGSAQDPTRGFDGLLGMLSGFITYDSLPWLHQAPVMTEIVLTVSEAPDDRAHIEDVAARVSDHLKRTGRQTYRTDLSPGNVHPLASIIDALLGVLGLLGVLVVFLSGSLVANTMSALLGQHLRQIGVMKLVGARRGQIITLYLGLIVAYGLLALAVGVPTGSWGAYALARFAASVINFSLQGYRLVPLAVWLQVAIALLVPPAAGLLPILNGSRTSVRAALSAAGRGAAAGARSRLDRWTGRVRWVSRPVLISLRNTFRRKGRLALTLLTLTLGGAVFIAVLNAQVALNAKVAELARYFLADVNIEFARMYRIAEIERAVLAVEGVERVEAWAVAGAELLHPDGRPPEAVSILAPPAESDLVEPVLLAGRWLLPGDERALAVSNTFLTLYPDLAPGDGLTLRVAGREERWTVVGIFQYTGVSDLLAYADFAYVARVNREPARAAIYRVVTAEHDLAAQQRVTDRLEQRFRDLGLQVTSVEAGATLAATSGDLLGILTTVLLVMALLTALVGSIGLAGTMSMNVMERTREIGVLRSIGAHNGIISRLVIVEGLVIGLLSYVLGGALSFPITAVLSNIISLSIFSTPAEAAFTPSGFVAWLGVVLALSAVASLAPARNATRLTIREVLAYE
jgi:putative ABC transport system permease protein